MNPLERLLDDNRTPSDTRYNTLSPSEAEAIKEAMRFEQYHSANSKILDDVFFLIGGQWHLAADIRNLLYLDRAKARTVELCGQIWMQFRSQATSIEYIKANFARAYGAQIGEALAKQAKENEKG